MADYEPTADELAAADSGDDEMEVESGSDESGDEGDEEMELGSL